MTEIKRKSRLSVRKSHLDLLQGRILEGIRYTPQKRKYLEGEREWGPRYRSSKEEEKPVLCHNSRCGVSTDKGLFSTEQHPAEFRSSKEPCRQGSAPTASHGRWILPAWRGQLDETKPQEKPAAVSPTTRPAVEEELAMFSSQAGAAVRLPGAKSRNPKHMVSGHPRWSVYEVYFGDDFGPDFEAAQVPTQLSTDALSK